MYCNKCGKEVSENNFYCSFCGCQIKNKYPDINEHAVRKFFKSRFKELFIFGMWFLFNSLIFLLIGSKRRTDFTGYGVNIYQICTFIAPMLYWGIREIIKYLLSCKKMSSSKIIGLKIISFLIGFIPIYFIFIPIVLIIGMEMRDENRAILNLILALVSVEFFYRDLFAKKVNSDEE